MRILGLIMMLAIGSLLALPGWAAKDPPLSPTTTKSEAELGAKTAEQIEKDYKLIKDDAAIKRLNEICAALAPFTQRPGVIYSCKILDSGELNAMSIPGGTIYVTKGLLAAVESDDELAGVLGHEMAHNSLCHAEKMMKREAKLSMAQLLGVIGTIYASHGSSVDAAQVIMMSQLVKQSLQNGYTVDLESQADANGLDYLNKSKKYNPMGLYSVILGFRQMDKQSPQVEMGYLKTHPYSDERMQLIEDKLAQLGIPINLWQVVDFRAKLIDPKPGEQNYTVRMGSVDLFTFSQADGALDAKMRAQNAVNAINRALKRDYIQQYDVDCAMLDGKAVLRMRRIPVLTLTSMDAQAANASLDNLGDLTLQRARDAIWREVVKRGG